MCPTSKKATIWMKRIPRSVLKSAVPIKSLLENNKTMFNAVVSVQKNDHLSGTNIAS